MLTIVTKDELVKRLSKLACRRLSETKFPIGLHCWPRGEHLTADEDGHRHANPHWFGIGPVDWGNSDSPPAWFDIRIQDTDYGYHAVNRLLAEACQETGLRFISMA